MKATVQLSAIPTPQNGVSIILEGLRTRLFFDFTDAPAREDEEVNTDLKDCESIDLVGRSYGEIVSAIINDRYPADKTQAIMANYENAKDSASDLAEEKRAEYLQEYADYQDWRAHAKDIAKTVSNIIEGE